MAPKGTTITTAVRYAVAVLYQLVNQVMREIFSRKVEEQSPEENSRKQVPRRRRTLERIIEEDGEIKLGAMLKVIEDKVTVCRMTFNTEPVHVISITIYRLNGVSYFCRKNKCADLLTQQFRQKKSENNFLDGRAKRQVVMKLKTLS